MLENQIDCPRCGQPIPDASFCVRCGESLSETGPKGAGRRGTYAAAPGESVSRIAPFSTLLPQLPDSDLDAFRIAFVGGFIALVVLVAIGAFPVAMVGAAVLVPAVVLIYVYSVDVYEDTPLTGIALTMVWGAAWGVAFGLATAAISDTGTRFGGIQPREVLLLGVVVPLGSTVVMICGPLLLMRDRRFNDVVDGATFGVASAVSFVGAQVIAGSIGLFAAGLTPVGEPLPWVARIVTIAVALPLVAAGAIGSAVAAFWLRYRAPVRDRDALGILGRPGVAVLLAAALLVAAALVTFLPEPILDVAAQLVLAAIALLWLRRTLHVGLLQESLELEIRDEIICANCGRSTWRHTFCGNCGISLHALPKGGRPGAASPAGPRAPSGDAGSKLGSRGVLLAFALVLGAILLIAAVGAILAEAPAPPPDCEPGVECGGPPPAAGADGRPSIASVPTEELAATQAGTIGIRAGTPWTNTDLGYEFEYTDWWALDTANSGPREAEFVYQGNSGDGLLIVAAVPTTEAGTQAYADQWFGQLREFAPDLKVDARENNAILGPEIGFIDGVGQTYAGSRTSAQSGTTPIGVSMIVASDGRTTAAVVLIVWNPDKSVGSKWLQYNIRGRAEIVLKTFRWGPPS